MAEHHSVLYMINILGTKATYSPFITMPKDLDMAYGYKARPSGWLNSIFMETVNMAAKTLVSVASSSKAENTEKWKAADHLRFMVMLMTWFTVWVLRALMDHFPLNMGSQQYLVGGLSPAGSLDLPPPAPSSALTTLSSPGSSWDLVLREDVDAPSVKALGRALSHVLALLNEIPATSRKYQFTMAMADKIIEENSRDGYPELLHVNRTALAAAFDRTATLLYSSLQRGSYREEEYSSSGWHMRTVRALPLGSYLVSYVKGLNSVLGVAMSLVNSSTWGSQKKRAGGVGGEGCHGDYYGDILAEKLAQELLWLTNKFRAHGDICEAFEQWSFASGLAAVSLTATPRVQGFIVKISAILITEMATENLKVRRQIKFRLLVLWLPLLCHAGNGVAYPVLTSFEKLQLERAMDALISSLPAMDQEVILTNWLQDFAESVSDWPNLQFTYDRWCQFTRQLAT